MATRNSPSTALMLARGAARRCARCGSGGLFDGWFRMKEQCPGCGMRFEREPGYSTGALAVNFAIVGAVLMGVIIASIAITAPDVPVAAVLAVVVPVAVLVPIAAYPISKTLWVAIDHSWGDKLRAS